MRTSPIPAKIRRFLGYISEVGIYVLLNGSRIQRLDSTLNPTARLTKQTSERNAQRQLNRALKIRLMGDLPEPGRRQIGIRLGELGMVEKVEDLRAELKLHLLR